MGPARSWLRGALAAGVLLALPAGSASADRPAGFEISGGLARLAMAAANDSLASLDQQLGTSFDPVHGGPTWGLAFRLWMQDDLLVRLRFERLAARSEGAGITFDLGADAYSFGVTWFPGRADPWRTGFGASLGLLAAHGGLSGPQFEMDSRAVGLNAGIHGEAMLRSVVGWRLSAAAGYRFARLEGLRLEGNPLDLRADYSGPFLRVGAAWDEPDLP